MAAAGQVHFVGLLLSAAGVLTLVGIGAARPHQN
jgi:hypothetical protein